MYDESLQKITNRLANSMKRDVLVQQNLDDMRDVLQVDRVVLYYFYSQWKGQVTFESVISRELSIFGATGADECFNGEYASLYEAGRVRAIADIELEPIQACHRDFLRSLHVRANLVVPILNFRGLWGLLVAHHCRAARSWLTSDIEVMQKAAKILALAPAIRDS